MRTQEYIDSGILEAYVGGMLDEEESKQVDAMASTHPEVHAELEAIRQTITSYAHQKSAGPSTQLLSSLKQQIAEEQVNSKPPADDGADVPVRTIAPARWWAVAASVLLLVSLSFNLYQQTKVTDANEMIARLQGEKLEITNLYQQTTNSYNQRMAVLGNVDNLKIPMTGLPISPESFATVYWNTKSNYVFISCDNLPAPPDGHQYQLWAIKDGQAPIDAGIFDHNDTIQQLKVIKGEVLAFAVTLEKEGGTPNATVDRTYVKGFI